MKRLALLLLLCTQPLLANEECAKLFTNTEINTCHNVPGRCATNIYHLASMMKNTDNAEVVLLFDPSFELFNPHPILLPEQEGWKFHVILNADGYTYDLNDPKTLNNEPLDTKTYFLKYYAKNITNLRAVRIPVKTYVKNFGMQNKNPKIKVWGGIASEPKGWMQDYIQENSRHQTGMPFDIITRFLINQVPYYLISEDYRDINPPVSVIELLK